MPVLRGISIHQAIAAAAATASSSQRLFHLSFEWPFTPAEQEHRDLNRDATLRPKRSTREQVELDDEA